MITEKKHLILIALAVLLISSCSNEKKAGLIVEKNEPLPTDSTWVQSPTLASSDSTQSSEVNEDLYQIQMFSPIDGSTIDTLVSLSFIERNGEVFGRLKYPELPAKLISAHSLVLANDSVRISISVQAFDSLNHQYEPDSQGYYFVIDGRRFWGTDGELPTREIKEVSLSFRFIY